MGVYLGKNAVEVYGGGVKVKPEEEKTVTASTSTIEVTPTSGMALKKVTVNPTPSEEKTVTASTSTLEVTPTSGKHLSKVTVNPTPSEVKTVTPSTSQQTVSPSSGKLLSQVTVEGDSDLISDNIRKGVDIFGVSGTLKGAAPNGSEWTKSSSSILGQIYAIHYADDLWVAGGFNIGLLYSTDGKTWTQSNITSENFKYNSIYWADYLWVAASDTYIYYSTDGKTWTQSSRSVTQVSVTYANKKWLALGMLNASSCGGWYSSDGKSWSQTSITGYFPTTKPIFTPYNWVAGSNTCICWSTSGTSWSKSSFMTYAVDNDYGNGVIVMACKTTPGASDSKSGLFYSTNGSTWTQSNITSNIYAVHYADGLWVASDNRGFLYSTDGKAWTRCDGRYDSCEYINKYNGIWVASHNTWNDAIYISNDGMTWNKISGVTFGDISYANGIWVGGAIANKSSDSRLGLYYSHGY